MQRLKVTPIVHYSFPSIVSLVFFFVRPPQQELFRFFDEGTNGRINANTPIKLMSVTIQNCQFSMGIMSLRTIPVYML